MNTSAPRDTTAVEHTRPAASPPGPGAAFLLAQLGAYAAAQFTGRVAELDLAPAQAGLLRAVAATPGQSQQTLAQHLGTPPSRLVSLVDALEKRGLLERRRNPDDRRLYALHLTRGGQQLLTTIGKIARTHDDAMCGSLDPTERDQLRTLLTRIADDHDLTPGVHPGYRTH